MKKLLLLLTMLVVVGISSYAADYTISFQSTANGATEIKTSIQATTFIEQTSRQYLEAKPVSAASKVYYGGQNTNDKTSLRFNNTSAAGNITFKLSEAGQVNATSIILSCKLYGTSDEATTVKVNDVESTKTISNTNDYEDIEIPLDGSKLTSIKIENSNAGKYRFYLRSIKVVSGASVTAPTITIDKEPVDGVYEYGAKATISGETTYSFMYTLDGSDPYTSSTAVDYNNEPFTLPEGEYTIKAIALDENLNPSEVTELPVKVAKMSAVVAKPIITITGEKSGENYLIGATASISAPNASYIFYTTDGSDPKAEGNAALEAVEAKSVDLGTLSVGPTTIQAYVWDAEGNESDVASMTVNVVKKPAELAWSKTSCTVYMGEEPYDLPTLTHAAGIADNEISYSIPESGANVATINQETGEISIVGVGSTTVRATYTTTEESEYASSWVQYTLNVVNKASIHETRYLFDFTINDNYGLTTFSSSKSGFETDTENPVTKISRKGVTLDFIIPEGDTGNSYRLWDGATTDLRIYKNIAINLSIPNGRIVSITFKKGNNAKFALIPEKGTLSGIQYINNQVIWKATEGESVTSIKFTSKSDSEWNNSTDGLTQLGGIEVVYDLGKPAMPYVVSEDESQIVIACDDYCVLHYTKVPHNGGAQAAPSRAALAGTGKDLVDSETWYDHEASTLTIDKTNQSHVNRGYTFTAYHGETDMRSDALNILVDQSGTLTGVEGISAEADADAPVEFYDLQGRKVANPQGGIFIRRQGNKVTKVAL